MKNLILASALLAGASTHAFALDAWDTYSFNQEQSITQQMQWCTTSVNCVTSNEISNLSAQYDHLREMDILHDSLKTR